MELTTSSRTFINVHRATIRTPLGMERTIETIKWLTTPQVLRFKWLPKRAYYVGQYRCSTPFTGMVTPTTVDLYRTTPYRPKKYLRVHGLVIGNDVDGVRVTELALRNGSRFGGAIAFGVLIIQTAFVIWITIIAESASVAVLAIVAMMVNILVISQLGNRQHDAFLAAVALIGGAIAGREPENDPAAEPRRAGSTRKP